MTLLARPVIPPSAREFSRVGRVAPWLVGVVVLCLIGAAGQLAVGAILKAHLAAATKQALGADLDAGLAWYIPPLGLSLHSVRLSRAGGAGAESKEFFQASKVLINLGKFPHQGEMLDVRRFEIRHGQMLYERPGGAGLELDHIAVDLTPAAPGSTALGFSLAAAHDGEKELTCTGAVDVKEGEVRITDLLATVQASAALNQAPWPPAWRQWLQAGHAGGAIAIRGSGSIPLDDIRAAVLKANIQLKSASGEFSNRQLRVTHADGEADVQCEGLNRVFAQVRSLRVTAGRTSFEIDRGNFSESLPSHAWKVTDLLGRLDVGGDVPFLDKHHVSGSLRFTGDAGCGVEQVGRSAGAGNFVSAGKAAGATSELVQADPVLICYPEDVCIQPPKCPAPIRNINGGPISYQSGVIRVQNLDASYGEDHVLLDEAHLTLYDPRQHIDLSNLKEQIRIEGISGSLVFNQPGPRYPDGLGQVIAQLRPSGSFAIGGGSWLAINRKKPGQMKTPKLDYFFRVSSAGGGLALTPNKVPLTDIHADATVSPLLVRIPHLRGKTLGGTVVGSARITPIRPAHYDISAELFNIDLQQSSKAFGVLREHPMAGVAYLKAHVDIDGLGGKASPLQTLSADGELDVVNGSFGSLKTVRAAASPVTKADQPLDGQAAAVFHIKDRRVQLSRCAVGNPYFGVAGSGTIGFDKSLDLHVAAAPLGDWSTQLRATNLPLLNDVGSNLAGAIEQLFVGAQQVLLLDVHVTGSTTQPTVQYMPAPCITAPLAEVFGEMIHPQAKQRLIDTVRKDYK